MIGKSKNNFQFKLWIVFVSFVLIWFAIICSGKGEGINLGVFSIKPISIEAISVLMLFSKDILLPLVRDVTGTIKEEVKIEEKEEIKS